jgi:hypothetical protein
MASVGNVGIDAGEGAAEPLGEDDFAVGVAFCRRFLRGDGRAVEDGVAQLFQVVEGGFFNLGFGHAVVTHGA